MKLQQVVTYMTVLSVVVCQSWSDSVGFCPKYSSESVDFNKFFPRKDKIKENEAALDQIIWEDDGTIASKDIICITMVMSDGKKTERICNKEDVGDFRAINTKVVSL